MKVFSLFSGIGGFDLAMQSLGHEIVGACETDKFARTIYARHFPNVRIFPDATTIDPNEIGDFDVLCAGFPCQAFSVAGKRLGFEDTRGTLFHEIARIAKAKKPRFLFLENVRGLLGHNGGRTMLTILQTLDDSGYFLEWQVFNSKYFVPQNRERVFIIGHSREKPRQKIFPLGEIDQDHKDEGGGELPRPYSRTIDANYWKGPDGKRTMIKVLGNTSFNPKSQCNYVYDTSGIFPTLTAGTHGYASGFIDTKPIRIGTLNSGGQGDRVYSPNGISVALSANGGGRGAKTGLYVDPKIGSSANDFSIKGRSQIRKLTPLECERLQGFPDNWTEGVSDSQRYKCLGNAVTVPVIEFIAKNFENLV